MWPPKSETESLNSHRCATISWASLWVVKACVRNIIVIINDFSVAKVNILLPCELLTIQRYGNWCTIFNCDFWSFKYDGIISPLVRFHIHVSNPHCAF
jgi:hypothetical protein